jgi:hypothetical protein
MTAIRSEKATGDSGLYVVSEVMAEVAGSTALMAIPRSTMVMYTTITPRRDAGIPTNGMVPRAQ